MNPYFHLYAEQIKSKIFQLDFLGFPIFFFSYIIKIKTECFQKFFQKTDKNNNKKKSLLKSIYEPGGVGPIRGCSPDGDASWDGRTLGIVVGRSGGCVALQYAWKN